MSTDTPKFAWCFSHGRLHREPQWCTAFWAPLPGATEEDVLEAKRRRFGDAQFMHHLPMDQQLAVMARREETDHV